MFKGNKSVSSWVNDPYRWHTCILEKLQVLSWFLLVSVLQVVYLLSNPAYTHQVSFSLFIHLLTYLTTPLQPCPVAATHTSPCHTPEALLLFTHTHSHIHLKSHFVGVCAIKQWALDKEPCCHTQRLPDCCWTFHSLQPSVPACSSLFLTLFLSLCSHWPLLAFGLCFLTFGNHWLRLVHGLCPFPELL